MIRRILTLWFVLNAGAVGWAHPGGLDSSGGHHDRKNGGYHYHRASSAPSSDRVPVVASPPLPGTTRAKPVARTAARTTARTTPRTSTTSEDRRELLARPAFSGSTSGDSASDVRSTDTVQSSARPAASAVTVNAPDDWLRKWREEARTFTSIAGTTLQARLKSVAGSGTDRVASLEREDRSVCRTPVVKLIFEDVQYIDTWSRGHRK